MADTPDVMKRLRMIENALPFGVCEEAQPDLRWLLSLTRKLLESQGELMAALLVNCKRGDSEACRYCNELAARAEAVRRGEGL